MNADYFQQAAILGAFVERVRATGHACGETLMQKAAFVMKELFGVPLSDEFRIHYYGPFSFQLRHRLSLLEAEDFLRVSPRDLGVTYDVGERFPQLREQFPRTIAQWEHAIDFAASQLGSLRVKELEPLTTALFVTLRQRHDAPSARVAKLMEIKPHVTSAEARDAIAKVDRWLAETTN